MFRLIDSDFAAARKGERGQTSPPLFTDFRDGDFLILQIPQGRADVVTHEEQFVLVIVICVVKRRLGRRQSEDQPSATRVDSWKLEDVTKKSPVGFGILAIEDNVCAIDHAGRSIVSLAPRLCNAE